MTGAPHHTVISDGHRRGEFSRTSPKFAAPRCSPSSPRAPLSPARAALVPRVPPPCAGAVTAEQKPASTSTGNPCGPAKTLVSNGPGTLWVRSPSRGPLRSGPPRRGWGAGSWAMTSYAIEVCSRRHGAQGALGEVRQFSGGSVRPGPASAACQLRSEPPARSQEAWAWRRSWMRTLKSRRRRWCRRIAGSPRPWATDHSRSARISLRRWAFVSMWARTSATARSPSPDRMAERMAECSASTTAGFSNSRSSTESTIR